MGCRGCDRSSRRSSHGQNSKNGARADADYRFCDQFERRITHVDQVVSFRMARIIMVDTNCDSYSILSHPKKNTDRVRFDCSLGYRPFMSNIQYQISLLNRLIISKQQQEQEQIPESPSPSPAPSAGSNQRGTLSRSRHSSISHASNTATLEEERAHESSLAVEESAFHGSYNNLNVTEDTSSQNTCTIS